MRQIAGLVIVVAVTLEVGAEGAAAAQQNPQAAQRQTSVGRSAASATNGTITGTVTDAAGEPLRSVRVRARELVTRYIGGAAMTTYGGQFTINGLRAGDYVLEVVDDYGLIIGTSRSVVAPVGRPANVLVIAAPTASRAAILGPAIAAARPQTVVGGTVMNPAASTITGTATAPTGEPIPNATVRARNLLNGRIGGSTSTSGTGQFTITGLEPGSYVLEVVDDSGQVIGTSAFVAATAGGAVSVAVTASSGVLSAVSSATGLAATFGATAARSVTFAAAAAGVAGVVAPVETPVASPSR